MYIFGFLGYKCFSKGSDSYKRIVVSTKMASKYNTQLSVLLQEHVAYICRIVQTAHYVIFLFLRVLSLLNNELQFF